MSEKHLEASKSIPIVGHGGTAYEGTDAHSKVVVISLAIIGGLAVLSFILMVPVQKYLETNLPKAEFASPLAPERPLPPAPQVEVHPWEDLPDMHQAEKEGLEMTGKDKFGRMHMPIDAAMSKVVSQIKVEPNAQRGLMTPGGQGREFSRSITELPGKTPAQIQGEVVKNAQ